MHLHETIATHLKEAMKSGDTMKRDTLRFLQSAIKNIAIEKRKAPEEFSDVEIEEVLRRLTKQRRDSIEQYRTGNRPDLAEKEEAELAILNAYLPQPMSEEELSLLVAGALQEAQVADKSQMGQAMGIAMKKVAGRASGDDVRRIVERVLS